MPPSRKAILTGIGLITLLVIDGCDSGRNNSDSDHENKKLTSEQPNSTNAPTQSDPISNPLGNSDDPLLKANRDQGNLNPLWNPCRPMRHSIPKAICFVSDWTASPSRTTPLLSSPSKPDCEHSIFLIRKFRCWSETARRLEGIENPHAYRFFSNTVRSRSTSNVSA